MPQKWKYIIRGLNIGGYKEVKPSTEVKAYTHTSNEAILNCPSFPIATPSKLQAFLAFLLKRALLLGLVALAIFFTTATYSSSSSSSSSKALVAFLFALRVFVASLPAFWREAIMPRPFISWIALGRVIRELSSDGNVGIRASNVASDK